MLHSALKINQPPGVKMLYKVNIFYFVIVSDFLAPPEAFCAEKQTIFLFVLSHDS